MTVVISEPWPRWVEIESADRSDSKLRGLSIAQAEGLVYALSAALAEAREQTE
jgi:hypothetical protein